MLGRIGIPELLVILAVVLLIFGPGKLSGVGRAIGQSIREFKGEVRAARNHSDGHTGQTHTTPR